MHHQFITDARLHTQSAHWYVLPSPPLPVPPTGTITRTRVRISALIFHKFSASATTSNHSKHADRPLRRLHPLETLVH